MQNPEASDDELLHRLRGGDQNAFTALYRRRQGGVYRFALHMSGSAALAEDVTQEVFMTLLREDGRYDPSRGSVAAYLYGVARNHVLRHLERSRVQVPMDDEAEEAGDEDLLADLTRRESIESLRQAVLALPEHYRAVVVLCEMEEMDYAGAAEALGCSIGTVRSRLHRARGLLLRKLNDRQSGAGRPACPSASVS